MCSPQHIGYLSCLFLLRCYIKAEPMALMWTCTYSPRICIPGTCTYPSFHTLHLHTPHSRYVVMDDIMNYFVLRWPLIRNIDCYWEFVWAQQFFTMTDQLNMGVRYLMLDPVYISGAMRLCHCRTMLHTCWGCMPFDKTFEHGK